MKTWVVFLSLRVRKHSTSGRKAEKSASLIRSTSRLLGIHSFPSPRFAKTRRKRGPPSGLAPRDIEDLSVPALSLPGGDALFCFRARGAGVCFWRRLRNLQAGFSQPGNYLLHLFARAPLAQF